MKDTIKINYDSEYNTLKENFSIILKEIKKKRKMTQGDMGDIVHISQAGISRWFKDNIPNAIDFLVFCKATQVDPGLFYHDQFINMFDRTTQSNNPIINIEENRKIGFVDTTVSKKIFNFLDSSIPNSINIISTTLKNGTSTALIEYTRKKNFSFAIKSTTIKEIKSEIEKLDLVGNNILIFDNAEKFSTELFKDIIDLNKKLECGIFFVGKNLSSTVEELKLNNFIDNKYSVGVLQLKDIKILLKAFFCDKSDSEIQMISVDLIGGIYDIMDYITNNL